jgi:hypothetical protein
LFELHTTLEIPARRLRNLIASARSCYVATGGWLTCVRVSKALLRRKMRFGPVPKRVKVMLGGDGSLTVLSFAQAL